VKQGSSLVEDTTLKLLDSLILTELLVSINVGVIVFLLLIIVVVVITVVISLSP
jgi:hypothetical protein